MKSTGFYFHGPIIPFAHRECQKFDSGNFLVCSYSAATVSQNPIEPICSIASVSLALNKSLLRIDSLASDLAIQYGSGWQSESFVPLNEVYDIISVSYTRFSGSYLVNGIIASATLLTTRTRLVFLRPSLQIQMLTTITKYYSELGNCLSGNSCYIYWQQHRGAPCTRDSTLLSILYIFKHQHSCFYQRSIGYLV